MTEDTKRKSHSIKEKLALFTTNPTTSAIKAEQNRKSKEVQDRKSKELENGRKSVNSTTPKLFASLYERTLSLIEKLYNVSGIVTYNNTCKKCIFAFMEGVKAELGLQSSEMFSISEVYKDDTNGLVKVIGIVDAVLDEIEARGYKSQSQKPFPFALGQASIEPLDNRSRSIAELLNTERKYIESLNELFAYKSALETSRVISNDLIHAMFANLAELLDFQRRFLFSLEATLALPPNEQHIGAIFIQYEDGFSVYNAMCASYSIAIKIVLDNQDLLQGVGSIDPKALQGFLIKPVQRICRYPMLLKEIIKHSNADIYPFCDELIEAEAVAKRATDAVNEVQRREENKDLKAKLLDSITDLQGLNVQDWGDLLLSDKFPMMAHDSEQIYGIYLFEFLILCCKEGVREAGKRRPSSVLKLDTPANVIKGKIYSTSISDVLNSSDMDKGEFELKVFWNDGEESFVLKCRNNEQAELWRKRIVACATGDTAKHTRSSSGSDKRASGFRRTVQSVHGNLGENSNTSMEAEKRTASLPAAAKHVRTKSGTIIAPRGSSIFIPQFSAAVAEAEKISMMSPSIGQSIHNQIPIVKSSSRNSERAQRYAEERSQRNSAERSSDVRSSGEIQAQVKSPSLALPKTPNSALGLPPSSSLPAPPQSVLPAVPKSAAPPSSDAPKAQLPAPPTIALPLQPTSIAPLSVSNVPPTAALPVPPLRSEVPQLSLPSPKLPASVIKISPAPKSALPDTPSGTVDLKPTTNNTTSARSSVTSATPSTSLIKMKIHYHDLIFILAVPASGARFEEILEKVERKMKIGGVAMPEGRRVTLKYTDEDGDLIVLTGDDDIELAFEGSKAKGSVTITAE